MFVYTQICKAKPDRSKGRIGSSTVIIGDFSSPLLVVGRMASRRGVIKWKTGTTPEASSPLDICRRLCSPTAGYTFFSSAHE